MAVVDFQVLHAGDLEAALATAERLMQELRDDPAWAAQIAADSPAAVSVNGLALDGVAVRVQQRVPAGAQAAVAGELRRRLAAAFAASGVGIGRWDTPLPIAGIAGEGAR